MDAATRTRALLERQMPIAEIVRDLRAEGFSVIESMSALIKVAELTPSEAKVAVIDSPIWAEQRSRIYTRRFIKPPRLLDDETVTQLREACGQEPEILEAWLIGNEMTASDGSSRETTGIALVLDPEFVDLSEKQTEYIAKLEAVAPQADVGGWLFRSRKFSADEAQRSLKIYIRPASAQ